jgi:hypothetical protein
MKVTLLEISSGNIKEPKRLSNLIFPMFDKDQNEKVKKDFVEEIQDLITGKKKELWPVEDNKNFFAVITILKGGVSLELK